jgi:pilus assembly protein CpaB
MRRNTLVMLLLAVVFGIGAVFLSNIWLSNQKQPGAAVASSTPGEMKIVVAAVPLRFGDRLTPENTREISWTASALPAGAFKLRGDLLGAADGGRQVLTPIGVNEPILEWKVTGPGQRATLSAVLTKGMKAVSIRVNDVLGVAGFVLPGDRVDILLSRNQDGNAFVDVLLQDIKVLAIDQSANDQTEDPTVAKAVTLEVATFDAQKLTLAAGVGTLSLALREVAGEGAEQTQRVSLGDLSAATVAQPALAAVPAVAPAFVAPAPIRAQVGVMRGVVEQIYDVPSAGN